MTKIKSINPNQLYISQNAEVSLKLAVTQRRLLLQQVKTRSVL